MPPRRAMCRLSFWIMTPEQMAQCQACAFEGQVRAWGADEFRALVDSDHVFAIGDGRSFALGRAIAGEAELLTIATAPQFQRQGLARQVLQRFEAEAMVRNADRAFLEVAETNRAAAHLYQSAGYRGIARREGYYQTPQGRVAALILEKLLNPGG